MTLTVFRLGKRRYGDQLFSGLGGLYAHSRWAPLGRPVVYTSGSISLAVLEYTVNYRRRGWIPASVLGRATLPARIRIESVLLKTLPANWSRADPPVELQEIGAEWLERGTAAVLKVPSAIVTEEWNYLLNPLHPAFRTIKLSVAEPSATRFPYEFSMAKWRDRARTEVSTLDDGS